MRLRTTLLATAAVALPALAMAQPVNGLYVGAGAGGNILQTEPVKSSNANAALATGTISQFGRGTDYRFDAGPTVVGSIGYGLGNGLRFELQGDYLQNKINGVKTGGAARVTAAGGDEYKYGAFINVLYDIPLQQFGIDSPVYPYLGGGVGYLHNKFNNLHVSSISPNGYNQFQRSTSENDNFAYQGIFGLSFPVYSLLPGLAFTAEYHFIGEETDRNIKLQGFTRTGVRAESQKLGDDFNHSILLGVRYAFNTPQPAPVAQPQIIPQQTPARTYLVFFDWDRADLTDRARQIIAEAAQASTRVQYTRIEVQGNADRSGTPAYNQRLSLRRAQTVAAELVRQGVPRAAIDIQAFGDTRPLVPTAAGVREPQNRRVAIILR